MNEQIILNIATISSVVIYILYKLVERNSTHRQKIIKEEKEKQFFRKLEEQLLDNSIINKEILKFLKISSQKYADEITESQARILIDSILSASQYEVHKYVTKIIRDNDIKNNEKDVSLKIKIFINNKFHKDYLLFKEFTFRGTNIGGYITDEYKEYITESMISNVMKKSGDKSLSSMLQNTFDSLKYDMIDKTLSTNS